MTNQWFFTSRILPFVTQFLVGISLCPEKQDQQRIMRLRVMEGNYLFNNALKTF